MDRKRVIFFFFCFLAPPTVRGSRTEVRPVTGAAVLFFTEIRLHLRRRNFLMVTHRWGCDGFALFDTKWHNESAVGRRPTCGRCVSGREIGDTRYIQANSMVRLEIRFFDRLQVPREIRLNSLGKFENSLARLIRDSLL